ncbi:hypothetical protein EMIT0180MI3_20660 [Priestia megaterium]
MDKRGWDTNILVEGRSERVCFLIKNQTRSDFFIMMVNAGFM